MKNRILKLLRKDKKGEGKLYAKIWKNEDKPYNRPLTITDRMHEWVYMEWAGMIIHLNVIEDRIILFCDNKRWDEWEV